MIGTKLAHYSITGHLGSGGMGDVYQATDSKLGRDVAIKLLPEAFTHDADRTARFEREARILASLNHPNIAAIYGVEESDGRNFLVMELVLGETLAERIKRGPIRIDEALNISKSICEALEAAHDKGVVHRDLKPANVKITPDGKVKVLDFGLAKAMEGAPTDAALSNSPTLMSMGATNAGVILGTAAYMSPEQAKGRTVDKRTDIFAFGAVLYEMLTGRAVFEGEDAQDILGAVLKSEPDWTRLPSEVPPRIRELLRLCLEKNAKNRRSDATDVRLDIQQVLAEPAAAIPVATPVRGSRLAWIVAAIAVLAAAVLTVPTVRHLREPAGDAPEIRTEITTPAVTDQVSFAISPDGRRIVFVASGNGAPRLWLRTLDVVDSQPLNGTESATFPFWSPDSRSVGFFAGGKLKRLDIGGGLPQTLSDVTAGRGGAWSPEGVILFAPANIGSLYRIPASGGSAIPATKEAPPKTVAHRFPQFLPDGRQFLFYSEGNDSGIYAGSLDSAEAKRLTPANSTGIYRSGWLFFIRQGTLVAQRLDIGRAELSGDPVTVADSVVYANGGITAATAFSISSAGSVAYRTGQASRGQLTWFDRSGNALGTFGPVDENGMEFPELSADGGRVAVRRGFNVNGDIWLMDAARMTRFTFDGAANRSPIWSPDGGRIVYRGHGGGDLYEKPSSGAGAEELLVESKESKFAADWSHDGRFLLYQSQSPRTTWDLLVLPLQKDAKPQVFLGTQFNEQAGRFSPDSHWVAYQSDESARWEIYVRPFPGPGGQWQISTAGGQSPRWRADGKEIYYIAPDGKMMATPLAVKDTIVEPGTPSVLFQTQIVGGGVTLYQRPQYDVAPDGRFLINNVATDDATSPITLLLNWSPEHGK